MLAACVESMTYTPQPPSVPQPRLPRNDAYEGSVIIRTLRPRFVWEPATVAKGAIRYELQYSADPAFSSGVTTVETAETSHQPDVNLSVSMVPPVGRRYYWRVRACVDQCSGYSPSWWVNVGRSDKDYNGDGYADVVVGAPSNDDNGIRDAGKVYVYFGGPGSSFNSVPDGTMTNNTADDRFGSSVSSAGDFNGDGFADVIVGAKFSSELGLSAGRAFLYFGGAGSTFDGIADATFSDTSIRDNFGVSVSSVGDMNGDGYSDVIVGAPGNDAAGADAGRAYVYLGKAQSPYDKAAVALTGEAAEDRFGTSVSMTGDFNGDGYADAVVAAQRARSSATIECRAYLFLGSGNASLDPTIDFTVDAGSVEGCTQRLGAAGDFNTDGFSDLVFGVQDAAGSKVAVYFGNRSKVEAPGQVLSLSRDLYAVTSIGDVNGDGAMDMAVGVGGAAAASEVSILLGEGSLGAGAVAPTSAGTMPARYNGDDFGSAIARAGDLNGDGFDDVVVGASNDNASGVQAGRAYVYFGNAGGAIDGTPDGVLDAGASESFYGSAVALVHTGKTRRRWD